MSKTYNPPKFLDVMAGLSPVKLLWENQYWSIGDWGKIHRAKVVRNNRTKKEKIAIFNTFVAALLQVVGTRGKYGQRIALMNSYFQEFSGITKEKAQEMLRTNKYPWISRGINVILKARELVEASSFDWELYFQEAERRAEDGFDDDPFLGIYGVGPKGRDFALGQFSLSWCAIDRHLAHILERTGLIYHGFNEPDFGSNPSKRQQYKFMQRLIIRFAKETGWSIKSPHGWSPSEIDSSLWFFGQGICKDTPECWKCPITSLCSTFKSKGES